MRIDVAFTPAEAGPAHVAVVVDVMRATSTIAQALASGYRRVLCCREIDDAYCAGRIVALLEAEPTDAAVASAAIARAYPTAWDGVNARTYGPPGLEDDLRWCTQENTLSVVPRFTRMVGTAAEITGAKGF